jgi:hypothetical protein
MYQMNAASEDTRRIDWKPDRQSLNYGHANRGIDFSYDPYIIHAVSEL